MIVQTLLKVNKDWNLNATFPKENYNDIIVRVIFWQINYFRRNLLGINKKNEHQMYLLLMKENKRKSTKWKSKLSNKRSLSKEYIRKHNKSHYQDIVGKIWDFKLIKVENFKSNKL